MQEIAPEVGAFGVAVRDKEGRFVFKFNANAAAKSLELVGKHVAVQAFREQVGHGGPDGGPIETKLDVSGLTREQLIALASVGIGDQ